MVQFGEFIVYAGSYEFNRDILLKSSLRIFIGELSAADLG